MLDRSACSSFLKLRDSLALTTWKDELPSAVILTGHSDSNAYPHIIMMHITHMWLIILLHRPFYRKVSPIPGSGSENISESVKVSRTIWLWFSSLRV
jgi:hypothetical protein